MEELRKYIKPRMEIASFETEDVITVSEPKEDDDTIE
jgi:hypothetical protein